MRQSSLSATSPGCAALLHYGSAIVELLWGDINPTRKHERSLMTARSPKTAAHDGHAVRIVPMTPELRPILQMLFDQAPRAAKQWCRD